MNTIVETAGAPAASTDSPAGSPGPTALDLGLPEPLPKDVRVLFDKCTARLGLIPNVLVAYAHRPEKLRAFAQMYNDLMLGESGLSKLEREMIAVAVSAQNRCWYCQVAHGAQVRVLSGDPALGEALVMNWRVAELSPRQRAMIGFAIRMTVASAEIAEADRQALRAHGLTEEDIWDVAAVAAFFNMSNRMASATGMVPNPDYHGMAR
jgi:uncharacterized peroxidase-related enzyme